MNHKTLFMITAVVILIFGLVWLIVPAFGLGLFGHNVAVNDLPSILTRYWGSAFVSLAVILWLARNGQANSIAIRAIIVGGFVLAVTGLLAALNDCLVGTPNGMIWLSIGLYAIFAVLYGIFTFKKPA